jgi:hypothetical protein
MTQTKSPTAMVRGLAVTVITLMHIAYNYCPETSLILLGCIGQTNTSISAACTSLTGM